MNLLLLNDVKEVEKLELKKTTASLYNKKLSKSLLIVAVHPADRMQENIVKIFADFKNLRNNEVPNF